MCPVFEAGATGLKFGTREEIAVRTEGGPHQSLVAPRLQSFGSFAVLFTHLHGQSLHLLRFSAFLCRPVVTSNPQVANFGRTGIHNNLCDVSVTPA